MRTATDIATCMYYTGIDPFTGEEVYIAEHLRDRKIQRALLQFFKPENYFEVREALLKAGQGGPHRRGVRLPDPGPPAEGGHRGPTPQGERGRAGRPRPHRGQPGEGRAARGAGLAESGLPTGAKDGTPPRQGPRPERPTGSMSEKNSNNTGEFAAGNPWSDCSIFMRRNIRSGQARDICLQGRRQV